MDCLGEKRTNRSRRQPVYRGILILQGYDSRGGGGRWTDGVLLLLGLNLAWLVTSVTKKTVEIGGLDEDEEPAVESVKDDVDAEKKKIRDG
jgi:hypothetical protein